MVLLPQTLRTCRVEQQLVDALPTSGYGSGTSRTRRARSWAPMWRPVIAAEGATSRHRDVHALGVAGIELDAVQKLTAPGRRPAVPRRMLENSAVRLPVSPPSSERKGRPGLPEIEDPGLLGPPGSMCHVALTISPDSSGSGSAAIASRSCRCPLSAGLLGHRPGGSRMRRSCRRARRRSRDTRPSRRAAALDLPARSLIVGPQKEQSLPSTDQRQHSHVSDPSVSSHR